VESRQYFVTTALCDEDESIEFKEVSESKIIALSLKKSNSFKNFESQSENHFYKVNTYMENARSKGGHEYHKPVGTCGLICGNTCEDCDPQIQIFGRHSYLQI
jgi:hypothetical protein